MDALRKQLDVLMGANRNGDAQEVTRKYYDRDVCRLFLAGLCPHELFQLTKMDKGPCPKVHSLQLRKEYEEAKAKGLDNYDRDLEDNIDRLIIECDRKIARALKRLDEEDAKAAIAISVSEVTQTPEIIELSKQIKAKLEEVDQADLEGKTDMKIRALEESMLLLDAFNKDRASLPQPLTNASQTPLPAAVPDPRMQEMINEKLKKAEDLGEQGMVDEAQKALEEAEALKKLPARQEPVLDSSKYTAADVRITDQKLRVCDICGAFLSVYDSDRRLADHFGGKLHLGYMQIREKLAELQAPLGEAKLLPTGRSGLRPPEIVVCSCIKHSFCVTSEGVVRLPGVQISLMWSLFLELGGEFLDSYCINKLTSYDILSFFRRSEPFLPVEVISGGAGVRLTSFGSGQEIGEAVTMTGNLARIVVEVIAMNVEGIMIVGAEIVIGIPIVSVIMTENVKETENVLVAMTQGVTEDLDPGRENVQEIMIATGRVNECGLYAGFECEVQGFVSCRSPLEFICLDYKHVAMTGNFHVT
ncbi:putative RNA-binding protein Luc7-like 1 [Sesamum angolense]|uniref:RNA-binding protein Luc7-like 1 n=1 Tax=Sesamum angolense TaxID=2727404 RepID=A0AAE1X1U9_9LAMI|nr:putative RNA-binding protein Luc7-like 1 [Sesamum angolense]